MRPQLLSQPDIDGGLIGGASLKAADFLKIVTAAAGAAANGIDGSMSRVE